MPYRSLIERLYTLNSPPVVSFNRGLGFRVFVGSVGSAAWAFEFRNPNKP